MTLAPVCNSCHSFAHRRCPSWQTRYVRIVLGSDHAGFELKQNLLSFVRELGHEVLDVGTDSTAAVDYPDFAEAVGMAVRDGKADRGVLICGSGVGASIAANKIPGVHKMVDTQIC